MLSKVAKNLKELKGLAIVSSSPDDHIQWLGDRGMISWSAVTERNPYGINSNDICSKSVSEEFKIQWGNAAGELFF
jgi:hypothetical protein